MARAMVDLTNRSIRCETHPNCATCVTRTKQTGDALVQRQWERGNEYAARLKDMQHARNIWRIVALIALAGLLAWAAFAFISAGIERGIAWGETTEAEAYWKAINEEMYRFEVADEVMGK